MLAQHGANLVEVDFTFANLQAFAVEPLGIAEMQMGGVRTESRQPLLAKSNPKWLAASLVWEMSTHIRSPCAAQNAADSSGKMKMFWWRWPPKCHGNGAMVCGISSTPSRSSSPRLAAKMR